MQNAIDDDLYSCVSFASSSSVNKENRFVCKVIDASISHTCKVDQPFWILDDEKTSTNGCESQLCMDIDERSLDDGSKNDFDIEDVSVVQRIGSSSNGDNADACELNEESSHIEDVSVGQRMGSSANVDSASTCEFNEQSQESPQRGNYVLPALSDNCLPFPGASMSRVVDVKSKRRRLGPLSSELLRRIRSQKSMNALVKFRAFLAEENTEEEPSTEFPDENTIETAWGVDMIGSSKDDERFIFRKAVNK